MTSSPLEDNAEHELEHPYYSVCCDSDPSARVWMVARRATYAAWRACQAEVGDIDADVRDWAEHAAELSYSTGGSERQIARHLEALETLDRMPGLRAHVEDMMHLDMVRICRIDHALIGLRPELFDDPEFWELLDGELTRYLTPSRPNQLVPSPSAIARKIRDVIQLLEQELAGDGDEPEEEEAKPREHYGTWDQADGSVLVEASHDAATATAIDKAIRAHAEANNIGLAQAHAELILKNVSVNVTLNLYQATDLPDAPVFLSPVGVLTDEARAKILPHVTRARDMDTAGRTIGDSYQVSPSVRTFLEGRDWVCRWPGCNRPAERSQKDHRVDYADGGPTAAANMISLCQHHHNRKTDRAVRYLLDPYTGDVYWLFEDHTWGVDEAEGPLAPRQRRWLRTLQQLRRARRERRR